MDKVLDKNNARAKKMMLWFGIISMSMTFAGLTSAYVVSSSRPDWLNDFKMPIPFQLGMLVILLSSASFYLARKELIKGNQSRLKSLLWITLLFIPVFIGLQFMGFSSIIEEGYYFTGSESTITTSFIYVIVLLHLVHLLGGIICLTVVLRQVYKNKYTAENKLGFELAETFWHFLTFLWGYLYLFILLF